jgi:hypothetical protein
VLAYSAGDVVHPALLTAVWFVALPSNGGWTLEVDMDVCNAEETTSTAAASSASARARANTMSAVAAKSKSGAKNSVAGSPLRESPAVVATFGSPFPELAPAGAMPVARSLATALEITLPRSPNLGEKDLFAEEAAGSLPWPLTPKSAKSPPPPFPLPSSPLSTAAHSVPAMFRALNYSLGSEQRQAIERFDPKRLRRTASFNDRSAPVLARLAADTQLEPLDDPGE